MLEGLGWDTNPCFCTKKKKKKTKNKKPFSVNRDRERLTMQIPFLNGEQAILYINKDAVQNT